MQSYNPISLNNILVGQITLRLAWSRLALKNDQGFSYCFVGFVSFRSFRLFRFDGYVSVVCSLCFSTCRSFSCG